MAAPTVGAVENMVKESSSWAREACFEKVQSLILEIELDRQPVIFWRQTVMRPGTPPSWKLF